MLFVTNGRFTEQEIDAYNVLRDYIFDADIVNYTTIVRTNFPNFRSHNKCEEDKNLMVQESTDIASIINSCRNRVIHVDNSSLNVDDELERTLGKRKREDSRNKLLSHLAQFQIVYKPANLDHLISRISNYMPKIERLQNQLEQTKNLSEAQKRQMQNEISELREKVSQ
ncbi:MAG TPA: hypothetical protein VKR58_13760, partial [Aquella sp.]|nr:hypothetical protein [Aquella sp.]